MNMPTYIIFQKVFNTSILFYLCICSGCEASDSIGTWPEAQQHCWEKSQVLKYQLNDVSSTNNYYWTGYYTRLSSWIKIIGCFLDSDLKSLIKITYMMEFGSAGFCQELCKDSKYFVFAVKLKKCVCLNEKPTQNSRQPIECSDACQRQFSNDTDLRFFGDCGGNNTFNVFKSDVYFTEKQHDQEGKNCMSLQCPKTARKFIANDCTTDYARICNHTAITEFSAWENSMQFCKDRKTYLLGNVELNNAIDVCMEFETNTSSSFNGEMWLGVAKEIYISVQRGYHNTTFVGNLSGIHISKCLKCRNSTAGQCMFTDCDEKNHFVCEKINVTIFNATITPQNENSEKSSGDESLIYIIPVVSFVILGASAALVFILWRRKMNENVDTSKTLESVPDNNVNAEINQSPNSAYIVLEQTNFQKTTPESDLMCESPYNDIENPYDVIDEGDYDIVGRQVF